MDRIDLAGDWTLKQAGKHTSRPASVPGCVHTDLLDAGAIEDPYFRDNEDHLQWIGETDWIYVRTFDVAADVLARDRVRLVCEGLDTLATIKLNGKVVGTADNMFRTWDFDAKPFLRAGRNRIEIRFASVIRYMERKQRQQALPGWGSAREVKGRAWVRKEPCNFGWDWGPRLVTCGIWRPIAVVAFDTARLDRVHVRQTHGRKRVTLAVDASVEKAGRQACALAFTLAFQGQVVAEAQTPVRRGRAQAALVVRDPQLWWPNGLGDQPLYELTVDLLDGEEGLLDTRTRRVGLRTLALERKKDRWGESFGFRVNGVPFFAKGANWIPADTFATRLTAADYAYLLQSARDANMNMLRVWGGGIYEDDVFYDLCDELGICIWQDFMFACSTYPAFDDAFLANVRAEAEENVARLRHHACLALWCGNNELEQGLVRKQWGPGCMSWRDYKKLFDRLLPSVVRRLDPDRDYWPSSAHSPHGNREDHSNPRWGDAHLWDVWHGRKPFEWYRTCEHRFVSEFGFQSFPAPTTVDAFTLPADRNVTSYVMEHHQRSGIGNTVILQYLLEWFRLPYDFPKTLWLTQILQGLAMQYAIEHWRRNSARTRGTIYWQLNDCWPVASWASIDGAGRWKALHYLARRFYAPLLVSGVEDLDRKRVELHVTNDHPETVRARASWTVTDRNGRVLGRGGKNVRMRPGTSRRVHTLSLREALASHGPRDVLVWLALSKGRRTVSRNLVLLARPKHIDLPEPGITTQVKPLKHGNFRVTLRSRKPAFWAWLAFTDLDAHASDNFFHLQPGKPVTVEVVPDRALTVNRFRSALSVCSLRDTYA